MKQNVIILTSGLTGSSVLAGLGSTRAGYWTGDSTHKKKDYDTYENEELIELNLQIFKEAGYRGDYLTQFSPEGIVQIGSLFHKSCNDAYRAFIDKCNQHRPWIWKDPRLGWMTIHFWRNVVDLHDCKSPGARAQLSPDVGVYDATAPDRYVPKVQGHTNSMSRIRPSNF